MMIACLSKRRLIKTLNKDFIKKILKFVLFIMKIVPISLGKYNHG